MHTFEPQTEPGWPRVLARATLLHVPIANCFTTVAISDLEPDALVAAWSERSGIVSDEMTVNLIRVTQGGKRYSAMAWLYLPSLWPDEKVAILGEGLAAALTDTLGVEPSAVQILVSVAQSGSVIESGKTVHW